MVTTAISTIEEAKNQRSALGSRGKPREDKSRKASKATDGATFTSSVGVTVMPVCASQYFP
jgi:hypothetical protein